MRGADLLSATSVSGRSMGRRNKSGDDKEGWEGNPDRRIAGESSNPGVPWVARTSPAMITRKVSRMQAQRWQPRDHSLPETSLLQPLEGQGVMS